MAEKALCQDKHEKVFIIKECRPRIEHEYTNMGGRLSVTQEFFLSGVFRLSRVPIWLLIWIIYSTIKVEVNKLLEINIMKTTCIKFQYAVLAASEALLRFPEDSKVEKWHFDQAENSAYGIYHLGGEYYRKLLGPICYYGTS